MTKNEALLNFFQTNGATSDDINDAALEYLAIAYPGATGQWSDDWFGFLRSFGYTGSLTDMLRAWEDNNI